MKTNKASSPKQFYYDHQNKINMIIILFLVGLFTFLAWINENRFFAIFIVFFFISASFFKQQRYFILIITPIIIFILFNSLTLDSLLILQKSDLPPIQHPKSELSNLFTPNSGQGVLPPQVLTMISVLKENNVESYKISEKFSNDVVIYQRIIEGAWPIRLENNSPFILISTDEINDYQECITIDKKEEVVLVNCN
jgi:hypothetical protein